MHGLESLTSNLFRAGHSGEVSLPLCKLHMNSMSTGCRKQAKRYAPNLNRTVNLHPVASVAVSNTTVAKTLQNKKS